MIFFAWLGEKWAPLPGFVPGRFAVDLQGMSSRDNGRLGGAGQGLQRSTVGCQLLSRGGNICFGCRNIAGIRYPRTKLTTKNPNVSDITA